MDYREREYVWTVEHEISPSGHDYGYSLKRGIKGSGTYIALGELTGEHLEQLADVLNDAINAIDEGEL